MLAQPVGDGPAFHAMTGQAGYDAIAFSGRPIAQPLPASAESIQLLRHLGVDGGDLATSRSRHDDLDALTLNLRTSGDYRGEVGGERVAKPLRRGQISFVPAGTDVSLEYPAAHSALVLYFPRPMLRALLSELNHGTMRPVHNEDMPRLAQLVRMVENELSAPGFASTLMIDGLIRAIGTGIIQFDTASFDRDAERIHLPPSKVRRIFDFVEANIDREIGLGDLAGVAGLSPFHFSRVFKRAQGETPCQFVRSRRLERARSLLATTDMPLAELSLHCGFANQSHFTAAFTRAMGVSPARYRRLIAR